ncbi:glutamate-cysteine ligase family protein [Pseudoduganella armeniaca]|uniref:glutamate--cysteine ligase n=1 Tax=Pseudoduganella armeniaca TaxID=2072590 RepID=A0A2R4CGY4_9BURK|nr:glutamate-cysteine ligase family protein [Pseudoduganella armeniaca]AVR98917.1 hypothetical protein C9I28_27320 [Pseudoduganella armeniaca]
MNTTTASVPSSTAPLHDLLYERFIAPCANKTESRLGIELEFPLIDLAGRPEAADVPYRLMQVLIDEQGFVPYEHDRQGRLTGVEHPTALDRVVFEYSVHMVEFSLAPCHSLLDASARFSGYLAALNRFLAAHGWVISGFGLHPHFDHLDTSPIDIAHYAMLRRFLAMRQDRTAFHHLDFFAVANASQVHVDCKPERMVRVVNLLSKLDCVMPLLFANSPQRYRDAAADDYVCVRDHYYQASTIGLNPGSIGPYARPFDSLEELLDGVAQAALWYIKDAEGRYIYFSPRPLHGYLSHDSIDGFRVHADGSTEPVRFAPHPDHLVYLKSFKHVTLSRYHTIEVRGICQQPVAGAFAPAAFIAGCLAELERCESILAHLFTHGSNTAWRLLATQDRLRSVLPVAALREAALALVACAQAGLARRGLGEAVLLGDLAERADTLLCPALQGRQRLRDGLSLDELIVANAVL